MHPSHARADRTAPVPFPTRTAPSPASPCRRLCRRLGRSDPAVTQASPSSDAERHGVREGNLPEHRRGEPAIGQGYPMIDGRKNGADDQASVQRSSHHGAVHHCAPEASALATDDEPGAWGHASMALCTRRACVPPYSPRSIAPDSPLHIVDFHHCSSVPSRRALKCKALTTEQTVRSAPRVRLLIAGYRSSLYTIGMRPERRSIHRTCLR